MNKYLFIFLLLVTALSGQTVTTTFKDSTAPGWVFGGTGYTPNLTSGISDPSGDGWLRMSDNGLNRATYAYYDTALTATNRTIFASVDFASYNGTGADGVGFFLFDGSTTFSIGASGGSLGYAQKTGIDGMAGGYIGVGLDDFGNYSNPTEGRTGGTGFVPNSVAVRGPGSGQTGYNFLGGTGDLSANPYNLGQMDFPSSTTRPDQTGTDFRHMELILTTNNQLSVYLQFGTGGSLTKVLDLDLSSYVRPGTLKFGFFSGTGASTDIHDIRSFTFSSIQALKWDNGNGNSRWNNSTNWAPNTIPTTGTDVVLDNTYVGSNQAIDLRATQTIRSLQIDAPFSYTLNNNTLAFNNNGIPGIGGIHVTDLNGTANHTINSAITAVNPISINNDSAGGLTINGNITTISNTVSVGGTGNTTINGNLILGASGLTKTDSGTVTISGTGNSYTGATTIQLGTLKLGASGVIPNTSTVVIGSGGTLNVNGKTETIGGLSGTGILAMNGGVINLGGTNTFGGSITGTGTINLLAGFNYTLGAPINNSLLTMNSAGGTINLNGFNSTIGTLNITGNTILDFGNSSATTLSLTNLNISPGVTLTITNWANSVDYFYAQNWTGATPGDSNTSITNRVVFQGQSDNGTAWDSFDRKIHPAPEPSTYGAIFMGITGMFIGWRRWKSKK